MILYLEFPMTFPFSSSICFTLPPHGFALSFQALCPGAQAAKSCVQGLWAPKEMMMSWENSRKIMGKSWEHHADLSWFITHDGSMVLLIYGVPWIPSIYPLYVSINIYIYIYQHQPDPSWVMTYQSTDHGEYDGDMAIDPPGIQHG